VRQLGEVDGAQDVPDVTVHLNISKIKASRI